jgi:2-oxoglutarate dehydrogenase E2 component (dihydrolipoamide succinyltransferase)
MPQLGETVTEGTITKWYKQVGDTIAEDEALFEVSTEKVDSEVPSPVSGTVTEILVPVGETVPVGTKLAVIGRPSQGSQAPSSGEAAQATTGEARAVSGRDEDMARVPETGQQSAPARHAASQGPSQVPAKPPSGGLARPGARPADQRPPSAPAQGGPSKLLSPVVRRLIAEHGLDPAQIAGTGAGGRITRDDVLAAIEYQGANGDGADRAASTGTAPGLTGPAPTGPAPARPPLAAEGPALPAPQAGERDTVVPFTNIRRRTAEHMARSKHISAHTMAAVEVDYSAVDKVRLAAREHFKATEGFSLTYLPFIARAVVDALVEWPLLNSSVGEDELIVHRDVNLGVAVDLEFEGLLVPVIHRADEKRMVAIAREISDLASRARSKRLTMDDISGGTFTLTNAGGYGTFITVPIINQPQVGIISTDGVRKRPVVVQLPDGSDGIAVRPVGNIVLSWDHRAVDGAYAAAFMARVRDTLQTRDWSAEL